MSQAYFLDFLTCSDADFNKKYKMKIQPQTQSNIWQNNLPEMHYINNINIPINIKVYANHPQQSRMYTGFKFGCC